MTSNSSPFFNTSYIRWLRHRVDFDEYTDLSMALAAIPFYSSVMMDRNRISDGESLRDVYTRQTGYSLISGIQGCSVLEFLVALAERVNDLFAIVSVDAAFAMFLENMDLTRCSNDWFLNQRDPECYIQDRCDIMMDRQYQPDGSGGGLFIVHDDKDIRPSEWWWQMQYWLNEQHIPDM